MSGGGCSVSFDPCRRFSRTMAMATLVLAGVAVSTQAAAETWTVVEGEKGSLHGVWQVSIESTAVQGSAAMLGPKGKLLSYRIAGEIRQGNLVVQRLAPNDRSSCTYVAAMNRYDKLAGSALCDGKSYPWHVTRIGKR
jgi:hypothetical protein